MMDIYDKAINALLDGKEKADPRDVMRSWDIAECLFGHMTPTKDTYSEDVVYGCITQIKFGSHYTAYPAPQGEEQELVQAIKEDDLIPPHVFTKCIRRMTSIELLKNEQAESIWDRKRLERFAYYQRWADRIYGRNHE